MLAMSDRHGRVWASVPGLANRARVPLEDAEAALRTLLAPDKYSRTPDHEGRRIEPIDGGWRLLNHAKYRDLRDEEVRREQNRKAQEQFRNKSADTLTVSNGKPESANPSAHTDAYTDADADTKNKDKEVAVLPPWLPKDEWKALLEVRKVKKAANTPRALNLLLGELVRLKSLGFDPAKVLDQSTLKGWKSVYPLKLDLIAVSSEPKGKLCDYCVKVSDGQVNGRRACEEHWGLAMDNTPTLKAVA